LLDVPQEVGKLGVGQPHGGHPESGAVAAWGDTVTPAISWPDASAPRCRWLAVICRTDGASASLAVTAPGPPSLPASHRCALGMGGGAGPLF